eukprot:Skav226294  [mRNA]  locus=scaffold3301:273509:274867:+ [translate_table: standard]
MDYKQSIPEPDESDSAHIFTDGTAYFSEFPEITLAAGAYVVAHPTKHATLSQHRSVVPGVEQNSFVGELWALHLALCKHYCLHVYTDCQAVVDLVQEAVADPEQCHNIKCEYNTLWQLVCQQIKARTRDAIKISKVKAHQKVEEASNEHEAWCTFHNNQVDTQAKLAITHDQYALFTRLQVLAQRQKQRREQLKELNSYMIEIAKFDFKHNENLEKKAVKHHVLNLEDPKLQFPHKTSLHTINITHNQYLAFPWGPLFMWRLEQWAKALAWPTNPTEYSDISILELYVDYVSYTSTRAPRNTSTKEEITNRWPSWTFDDYHCRADGGDLQPLNKELLTFSRAILWLCRNGNNTLWKADVCRRSYSLASLGYSGWLQGITPRPLLSKKHEAAVAIHKYFTSGAGAKRNMHTPLSLPVKPWTNHPKFCDTTAKERVPQLRRSRTIFAGTDDLFT